MTGFTKLKLKETKKSHELFCSETLLAVTPLDSPTVRWLVGQSDEQVNIMPIQALSHELKLSLIDQ